MPGKSGCPPYQAPQPDHDGEGGAVPPDLERELLDDVKVWPDAAAVQAAVGAFRIEYNTNRPHQSLEMAFPADRFTPRPADQRLPLRLPARLSAAVA